MEPLDEWTIINNLFEYINFEWNDTAPYVSVDWQKGPAFNTKCKSSFENALKNPQHSLFSDFIYLCFYLSLPCNLLNMIK